MAKKASVTKVSTPPTPSAAQQTARQMAALPTTGQGEFLLYQTEDAQTRVQVRLDAGDVWLTQQQLADLYQSSPQNITQHIRAIYQSGELQEAATCKPYLQVRQERGRQVSRSLKHYNLEVVLAKAQAAYAEYQARIRDLPSPVERDFEAAIAQPVKQLEKSRKTLPRQKKGGDT